MPTPASAAPQRLVSIAEAAARLNVSTKTIRRRIADGTLTAYRIGPRVIRIDHAEIEQLLRPIGGSAAGCPECAAAPAGGEAAALADRQAIRQGSRGSE